ncbi:hypothetical protein J2046_003257 [Rhizobium petrolearium]|uniref:hypothetical protein n=1 Tax=Neorhizobium petrolearium TaxID=515361 RepID=UPI001AE20484|nr:hypothetical protein [Neorhizobium petrolearium]MBP1844990.1 hypothetical protein [Neorhizobium petrolearium]
MNKAFALAVLMSVATMGSAYAREMGSMAVPAGNNDVQIIYTDPGADDSARFLSIPDTFAHPDQSTVKAAQNEVRTDSRLRQTLVSQNVELNNVVGIEKAADGSRIVYVR